MTKKYKYPRGNKHDKVILIQYENPLWSVKYTEKLEGECSPFLRDRRRPQPISIIRINSRLRGFRRFEVLIHEFFHKAAEEVFGYQGDEDIVTPLAIEITNKYKTYLKNHDTKENIRSLKCGSKKKV